MTGPGEFPTVVVNRIARLVDRWMTDADLPGLVVSVFDLTGRRLVIGRGFLDQERSTVPDATSIFRIASMSKSFTSAAVLLLRDEGVLTLDAPIADLAPSLAAVVGPTADAPPITLRHLLTMSSGLASDDPWADRLLDADPATMDSIFGRGAHFAHAAGTTYEYSNLGFAMIGRVVESVTGRPVQDHVRTRLLEPLGMSDTGWHVPEGDRVATGHRRRDGRWLAELAPLGDGGVAPMGGLWTTTDDLERWIRFQLDAFPARDDPDRGVLRRSSRREQQRMHTAEGRAGQSSGYGMGLRVLHHPKAGHVVAHSGGLPGFGSNMRWLVDRGIGVTALANLTYAPMWNLTGAVVDLLAELDALGAPRSLLHTTAPLEAAHRFLGALLLDVESSSADDWRRAETAEMGWSFNVDLDEPFERRHAEALRMLHEIGAGPSARPTIEPLTATSAAAATFRIAGPDGSVTVEFQLDPQQPPRIQHLFLRPF